MHNELISTKEQLYITAIQNLQKQVRYLQLSYTLQSGTISEEEFEQEIESNPDKYTVEVKLLDDQSILPVLNEVILQIGNDLSVDEVMEIFSIDLHTYPAAKEGQETDHTHAINL